MTAVSAASKPESAPFGAWWTTFFDETYASIGLVPRLGPHADAMADGIVSLLALKPNERVFDQCCGIGRVALPLARRGVSIEGVELAKSYVEVATSAAQAEKLPAEFFCADAYSYIASKPCDAAINVFTSFGYSDDDGRNEQMLRRAFESLRPGGRFLLERVNPCWIVAFGLSPVGSRVTHPDGSETLLIDEPEADWLRGTVRSTWSISFADGRRETRRFETRMYFPNELAAMAQRVGFTELALYGGIAGVPYDRHSRRLVITARRP
ncbi:MAG: methyltransferase domain-containing protein [Phycisphaerae bacterium]|nr:methyltransferase domain-containing protein [Phycisphaerae bacterium]